MNGCTGQKAIFNFRNVVLFIVIIAVVLIAPGCGRESASKKNKGKVTLTLACWEGPEGLQALKALLDQYKKENPHVDIEIQQVPGSQYYQRLKIQFAGGVAPDIMQLAYDQLPSFASKGTIEPLDRLIERDKFPINDMFPQVLPALKYKGQFYGLPRGWTTFVLYYNKDMFREAGVPFPREGWTWDDFLYACRKISKDTDGDGKIDRFGCDGGVQYDAIAPWVWQNGGRVFTPDMSRCLLNSPEAIEALQFLQDCQKKYKVFPSPMQAQDLGGGGEMFRSGRQAMFIQGRWACLSFRDAAYPDGRKINWDVAPLPGKKEEATVLFANCYVLRKDGPNLEEAWKLMQFLTGYTGQAHQARTGRDMPSLVSVAQSPDFMDPNNPPEHDEVFLQVAEHARPLELDENAGAWGDMLNGYLIKIMSGQMTAKDAMNEAVPQINKLLARGKE